MSKTIHSYSSLLFIAFLILSNTACIHAQDNSFIADSLDKYVLKTDIHYGDHERQVFDLVLPDTNSLYPLVVFIHGGGFKNGDKVHAFERYMKGVKKLMDNKVAFATINYRFLEHSDNGVMTCLEDGRYCVQHLKHYALDYNIDPDKIVAFGESAGAGMSLWLALSDNMADSTNTDPVCHESSRICAAGAFATQSTYDILRWEEVFEDWDVTFDNLPMPLKRPILDFYGAEHYNDLKKDEFVKYRKDLDFFELMSQDDPPIWVRNNSSDGHPLFFDTQHHPLHAKYLKTYAEKAGVEHMVFAPALNITDESEETLMDFFLRILTE